MSFLEHIEKLMADMESPVGAAFRALKKSVEESDSSVTFEEILRRAALQHLRAGNHTGYIERIYAELSGSTMIDKPPKAQ